MLNLKNKGVLLLEVMLAVTILSVGLILVVRSYIASLRTVKISQDLLVANLLLGEKIWQKEQESSQDEGIIAANQQGSFPAPFAGFNYQIEFSPAESLPAEYTANLYKASFKVFWQQRGKERSASSLTYLRTK